MQRACLAALIVVTACGNGPGKDGCMVGDEPTLSIGLGESRYTALTPGEVLPFVYGPQGGYHLELGLEATQLDAEDLVTGSFEGRIDGEVVATSNPWLTFRCDDETRTQQSWGTLLIFDTDPEDLHDVDVQIDAEVTDMAGASVMASLVVHIVDPENPGD